MTVEIAPHEHGVVRIFALSMTAEEARALHRNKPPGDDAPTPIEAALGVTGIDPAHVAVFPLSDIEEIGLDRYLEEGSSIDPAQLDPDRRKLAALDGWVLVVHSAAFGGRGVTLTPTADLTLIGTYSEPGADWSDRRRLESPSARATGAPAARKAPSDAAMSGRIATIVLLVLFGLTAVMVWISA